MREHLRACIWPRNMIEEDGKKNYRYAVIGMLVTDKPIQALEGKDEVYVDGPPGGLSFALNSMRLYRAAFPRGEASNVLCGLQDTPLIPLDEEEDDG